MEVLQSGREDQNPRRLLREAKNWLEVYKMLCSSSQNTSLIYQLLYSFFFAVELYLKSYIILQNHEYADSSKIKKLNHNFQMMRQQVQQSKDKTAYVLLKKLLDNNQILLHSKWNEFLRYVPAKIMISIERDMEQGIHDWQPLFSHIESIVEQQYDQWEHDHYPKKESYSSLLSIEAPKDKKMINKISRNIIKTCPNCRPNWVIAVFRSITFPWSVEPKMVKCKTCGKDFVLNESWVRELD